MRPFDPVIDAAFREYAELQLRRHNLLQEGKENTPETAAIEDRMDVLWGKLDEDQRRNLNGMASDLNWVRRNGEPPPKGPKSAEEVAATERDKLVAAMEAKEWHGLLHQLRVCAPTVSAVHLAFMRGTAYGALGFPAYSSVFFEKAAEIDPANALMGVVALRHMEKTNASDAVRRAEKIIASPLLFPPVVLALSAVMILRRDETAHRPIDRQRFSAILNDAMKRLQLEPPSDAARAMAYQAAASGFQIMGDLRAAQRCLDEGLQLSPNNDVLLVGKGLLLYGSQTDQAVEAFSRVARQGTPSVWPYFFLAHHYLLNRDYNRSLEKEKEASERATTNSVQAELLQWRAICLAELHFPADKVRSLFEKAVSLDPSNPHIAKNLAAFDEAVAEARDSKWHIQQAHALKEQRANSMRDLELVGIP